MRYLSKIDGRRDSFQRGARASPEHVLAVRKLLVPQTKLSLHLRRSIVLIPTHLVACALGHRRRPPIRVSTDPSDIECPSAWHFLLHPNGACEGASFAEPTPAGFILMASIVRTPLRACGFALSIHVGSSAAQLSLAASKNVTQSNRRRRKQSPRSQQIRTYVCHSNFPPRRLRIDLRFICLLCLLILR